MPPLGITDSADQVTKPSSHKKLSAFARHVRNYDALDIKWPHASFLAPIDMARAGFCYHPTSSAHDNVQCYSCGIRVKDWVKGSIPVKEHLRYVRAHRPNCKYLDRYRRDHPGILEKYENQLDRAQEIKDRKIEWPHASPLALKDMAEAGFRHHPTSSSDDTVKCDSCLITVWNWADGFIPLKEHLRLVGQRKCKYLNRFRTYNRGVLEKYENELEMEQKAEAGGIDQERQQQESDSERDHAERARIQHVHQMISEHTKQLLVSSLQQLDQSEQDYTEACIRHQEQQLPHRDKIERCQRNNSFGTGKLDDEPLEEHMRSSPECSSLCTHRVNGKSASESALISAIEKAAMSVKSLLQSESSIEIVPKAATTVNAAGSAVPSRPTTPTQADRSIAPASQHTFGPHCGANSENALTKAVGPLQSKAKFGMGIGDWEELELDGEENDGWIEV